MASLTDFADAFGWSNGDEIYMAVQILIFFSGSFVIFVFSHKLKIKEEKFAMTAGQRFGAVFMNVPMLIYLGYLLVNIILEIVKAN